MNESIKSKMKAKNILYIKYIQNGRFESDFIFLENLITELNELISSTKAWKKIKQRIIASKNLLVNPKNIL